MQTVQFIQLTPMELDSMIARTVELTIAKCMSQQQDTKQIEHAPATRIEAAQYLGISTRKLDEMLKAGIIPSMRVGRNIRISWNAITAYLNSLAAT